MNARETWRCRARFGIAVIGCVVLAACDNMKHQRGPNDYRAGENEHPLNQIPPANTVAQGSPDPADPIYTGSRAGQALAKNPLPVTRDLLVRGRERFGINCAPCHGDDGYGKGIVVRRGFPAPPSLHEESLRVAADGHLFDVMTRGTGTMLPFADRLTPSERWAVVAYIRALQLSQRIPLRDLPADERARFASP